MTLSIKERIESGIEEVRDAIAENHTALQEDTTRITGVSQSILSTQENPDPLQALECLAAKFYEANPVLFQFQIDAMVAVEPEGNIVHTLAAKYSNEIQNLRLLRQKFPTEYRMIIEGLDQDRNHQLTYTRILDSVIGPEGLCEELIDRFCKQITDTEATLQFEMYKTLISKNYDLTVNENKLIQKTMQEHFNKHRIGLENAMAPIEGLAIDYSKIRQDSNNIWYYLDEHMPQVALAAWDSGLENYVKEVENLDQIDLETGVRSHLLEYLYAYNIFYFNTPEGNRTLQWQAAVFIASITKFALNETEIAMLAARLDSHQKSIQQTMREPYQRSLNHLKLIQEQFYRVDYNTKNKVWMVQPAQEGDEPEIIPNYSELDLKKQMETDQFLRPAAQFAIQKGIELISLDTVVGNKIYPRYSEPDVMRFTYRMPS